jgi:peptide/nickel transport system ATP-binding protein
VFTIGQQVKLVLKRHGVVAKDALDTKAAELLGEVGLPDPRRVLRAYPHELSGGMQQRVMISMAVATKPDLLVADEPTTALDVTIQSQVLELLNELRETYDLAVMLITHSVAVVEQACQDVVVVYAGRAVEQGPVDEVLEHPRHPYTQALLGGQPRLHQRREALAVIPGGVPSVFESVRGCPFAPRCRHVMPRCLEERPSMLPDESVTVACHLYDVD